MSRSFTNMFASSGQAVGGGGSGNAVIANAAERLHFGFKPNSGSTAGTSGILVAADIVTDIPFVARRFSLSREQIEAAACSISAPGSVASAVLRQIRNNQVMRSFNVNYAGAGQIQPPTLTAQQINGSNFTTVPGVAFEFAATYVDPQGNSGIGNPVIPANTGLDMSVHRLANIIYNVANDPGSTNVPVNKRKIDISQSSGVNITLAAVRTSDNKQAGNFNVPLGAAAAADWTTLSLAAGYNQPPRPYDSGSTSSTSMEYCWGIIMPGNTMVRLSDIFTSNRIQFYGGNGWSEDEGSYSNVGVRCLVKMGTTNRMFMGVTGIFMWRKVGSSAWCTSVNTTINDFPIASYTTVSSNLYDNSSAKYTEGNTFPSFTFAEEIRVNWNSYSAPLGLTGLPGNVQAYARNNLDQYVIPKNGVYVVNYSAGYWDKTALGVPYTDTSYNTGTIMQASIIALPTNQLMDDPANRESVSSPKGDEFYTGLNTYAISLAVPAHANASGANFYLRQVTRSAIDGSLTRGPWYAATTNIPEENGQFAKTIRGYNTNAVTPPATNTTNTYASSYVGKVIWDNGANPVDFEVGDQFRLQSVTHNIPQLGQGAELNISMEYSLK